MQTQNVEDHLEDFEGIDGHYYYYLDPSQPKDAEKLEYIQTKAKEDLSGLELVAEYEYVLTDAGEDELMMDKYVMAKIGANTSIDYEFLLMANDWIDLDLLADHESFRAKVLEAEAKRTRGILVTEAFAKTLMRRSLRDVARNVVDPLPTPPELMDAAELMTQRHSHASQVDTSHLTRKQARRKIAQSIEKLKQKHSALRHVKPVKPDGLSAEERFSPAKSIFYDIRKVEADSLTQLHQFDLAKRISKEFKITETNDSDH